MYGQGAIGWKMVLLLAASLWLASGTVQGHGGGGGGGGGHGGGGGGHGGGGHGGASAGGHGGGMGHGHGGGHHGANGGLGLYGLGGFGYWPYAYGHGGYGYGYRGYGYSSASAAPSSAGDPDNPYGSWYSPRVTVSLYAPPPSDNIAYVRLMVPEDATVWFDGVKTEMTGQLREFETPALTPGKKYRYRVKAQWREKGNLVERERTVVVQPNAWTMLDLTEP